MNIADELKVFCIRGEGHECAEDAGGICGWAYLKELFKPRKKDPEDRRGWYKEDCGNGDPKGLNPWKWDILDVNDGLMELNEEWYGSLSTIREKRRKKEVKK